MRWHMRCNSTGGKAVIHVHLQSFTLSIYYANSWNIDVSSWETKGVWGKKYKYNYFAYITMFLFVNPMIHGFRHPTNTNSHSPSHRSLRRTVAFYHILHIVCICYRYIYRYIYRCDLVCFAGWCPQSRQMIAVRRKWDFHKVNGSAESSAYMNGLFRISSRKYNWNMLQENKSNITLCCLLNA